MGRGGSSRRGRSGDSSPRRRPTRPGSSAGGPDAGLLGTIPTAALDLHGDHAREARRRVRNFLQTQARVAPGEVVHIVTGSGLGSPGGPVLRGQVGELLAHELSGFVDEYRLDLHRGGWLVRVSPG